MPATRGLSLVSTVLRVSVALAFVLAGALKMRDPMAFAEQVANYQLYPTLANYVANTLPTIEITASLALLFGKGPLRHAGALTLFALLGVFTTALIRAWALGINLECGCFGVGSTQIGVWPVLRNITLMTAIVLTVMLEPIPNQSAFATKPSLG